MASKRLSAALALAKSSQSVATQVASKTQPSILVKHGARSLTTTTPIIGDLSMLESMTPTSPIAQSARAQPSFSPLSQASKAARRPEIQQQPKPRQAASPRYDPSRAPSAPAPITTRPPLALSESLKSLLPHLASQPPFYMTAHIHGKPYLVTEGDTVRLPFLMHGVQPGDVLRLDRATLVGSREWTLRGSPALPSDSAVESNSDQMIIGRTDGLIPTPQGINDSDTTTSQTGKPRRAPPAYVDERLFTCRATVLGTESEPLRIKEKKKQRQRRLKKVKSKHRYTILKISEIKITGADEVENELGPLEN